MKPPVRANVVAMEEDVARVCEAFEDMEMSEDDLDMDPDTDNDAVFNTYMVKSVTLDVPDEGKSKPELVRNQGPVQRAKANAGRRYRKREMEEKLKKKMDSILQQLWKIENRQMKRHRMSSTTTSVSLINSFMILTWIRMERMILFLHINDTWNVRLRGAPRNS